MCERFDGNLADDRRARWCTVLSLVVLRIETGNLWRRGKGSSRRVSGRVALLSALGEGVPTVVNFGVM